MRVTGTIGACILLSKPRIVLLVATTALSAMVLEGTLLLAPCRFAGVLAGICLAACAANAFNQFWDRDIDAAMARTRTKRPIPTGKIGPCGALWFGAASGTVGVCLLVSAGNALAAALGFGTIVFYVCVYTMWLKRRTSWNIVVGGIAGATPPLIGWAAGAGDLDSVPLLMSLIVFLWTPPHFWALALYAKNEYASAGVPMLPVVAGEKATRIQIASYTSILLPVVLFFGIRAELGSFFLATTTLTGLIFAAKVVALWIRKDDRSARELFGYSIFYLTVVFAAMLAPKW